MTKTSKADTQINDTDLHSKEDSSTTSIPNGPDLSIEDTLKQLNISPSLSSTSTLSPVQIKEITNAIIDHLQIHGRVTITLIKFIKDGYSSTTNSTSSTPTEHPILLSSNKMSNAAPKHLHFTIPRLSRYFGFRSFKNWDVLHDVCQPNFSFLNSTYLPLELGQVANIKKARSNKTPIDHPPDFLDVVHCDIGYGATKSIGNGASHCLLLVDQATRYTWIYPLKMLHHESIKAALSAICWYRFISQAPLYRL
jgi:hypothetical protein